MSIIISVSMTASTGVKLGFTQITDWRCLRKNMKRKILGHKKLELTGWWRILH